MAKAIEKAYSEGIAPLFYNNEQMLVIELKWNKKAERAIQQIRDRNYPQALEGIGADILLVAITYDEKTKKHACQIESHSRAETG